MGKTALELAVAKARAEGYRDGVAKALAMLGPALEEALDSEIPSEVHDYNADLAGELRIANSNLKDLDEEAARG